MDASATVDAAVESAAGLDAESELPSETAADAGVDASETPSDAAPTDQSSDVEADGAADGGEGIAGDTGADTDDGVADSADSDGATADAQADTSPTADVADVGDAEPADALTDSALTDVAQSEVAAETAIADTAEVTATAADTGADATLDSADVAADASSDAADTVADATPDAPDAVADTSGDAADTGAETAQDASQEVSAPCGPDNCASVLPCVVKSCQAGACAVSYPKVGCDDGTACTSADTCDGKGNCGGLPKVCGDNNPCTTDGCDSPTAKCVFLANAATCEDANPCTANDACDLKACGGGVPTNCDDGNSCTTDSCNATAGGCVYNANATSCDDGQPCTVGDACKAKACVAGAPQLWQTHYGDTSPEQYLAGVVLPDGRLAAVGYGNDASGKKRGLLTVWNKAGATEVNTFGSDSWVREIHGIANTGDGALVVTGLYENLSTGSDAFIALHKPSGGMEWLQLATGNSHDHGDDVAPIVLNGKTPQGFVIAGTYSTTFANPEGWLVKYKTDSSKAADFKWGLGGYDQFRAVATAQGGAIVAGGNTTSYGSSGTNGAVVRFNHNLAFVWQTILDGPGEQFVNDVQFAGDGTIWALGTNTNPAVGAIGKQDLWLVKLDADGNVLWQRTFGTKGDDYAGALAVLSDGFAIAGSAGAAGGSNPDGLLIRLDALGNQQWQYPFGDGLATGAHEALHDVMGWDDNTLGAVGRTTNGTPGNSDNAWVVRASAYGHQTCGGAGGCFGKGVAKCADDNPCVKPNCDPLSGSCKAQVFQPEGTVCLAQHCADLVKTPESACNSTGDCLPTKMPTTCDDKNPCTTDSCNAWNLSCQNATGYTGTCDSGTTCFAASCANGSCAATTSDKLWTTTAVSPNNNLPAGAVTVGGGALWAVGRTNKPGETNGDTLVQPFGVDGVAGTSKVLDLLKFGLDEQLRGVVAAGATDTVVVGGRAQLANKDYQLVLASIGAAGVQWAASAGGAAAETGGSVARIPQAMPEGGAGWLLAGGSLSSGVGADNGDAYLVRFDLLGVVKTAQFNGFGGAEQLNAAAAVDGTHAYSWGFVAAGQTKPASTPQNAYLWRTDAKLQTVWQKSYGGPGNDAFQAVAVLRDAKGQTLICAAGESAASQADAKTDGWLSCYDGFGTLVWEKKLGGPEGDAFLDLAALPDGSLLAAGSTYGKANDAWLVKFDPNGNVAWQKTYGGAEEEVAVGVTVLGGGGLALTVQSTPAQTGISQVQVLRLDAFGHVTCAASGACAVKAAAACDDGNPCTADTCGPNGACGSSKLADGTACGAGKVCGAGLCK